MLGMNVIYQTLAMMSAEELRDLAQQLQFNTDPWAVGARKLVDHEILRANINRNKIVTF